MTWPLVKGVCPFRTFAVSVSTAPAERDVTGAPADVRVNVVVVNCALSGLKRPRVSSALNARDQYEVFAGRARTPAG